MKIPLVGSQTKEPYQIQPGRCKKKLSPVQVLERNWTVGYIAEPKLDGIRYLWQLCPNGARQNFLTSRRISVKTGKFVQKEAMVPWLRDFVIPASLRGTVLDGELTGGSLSCDTQHVMAVECDSVIFNAFDIIYYQGRDVRDHSFSERKTFLGSVMRRISDCEYSDRIKMVSSWYPVTTLLNRIKAEGGEGIVIKHSNDRYGEGWIKVPFEGDPVDCVIVGLKKSEEGKYAKQNLIGALVLAQWVPKAVAQKLEGKIEVIKERKDRLLIVVGTASGFTDEIREDITANPEKYLDLVVEVEYKSRFNKTGRFRHIRFNRFRFDKDPSEAVWDGK